MNQARSVFPELFVERAPSNGALVSVFWQTLYNLVVTRGENV